MTKRLSTKESGIPYTPTKLAIGMGISASVNGMHQATVCKNKSKNAATTTALSDAGYQPSIFSGQTPSRHRPKVVFVLKTEDQHPRSRQIRYSAGLYTGRERSALCRRS